MTAFSTWRMMETGRREHAEQALQSIAQKPDLSRDVGDIVSRSLEMDQLEITSCLEGVTQISRDFPKGRRDGKFFINLRVLLTRQITRSRFYC